MSDIQKIEQDLIDSGALLEGHFLLTSGLHSGHYLQCALLLRYPDKARRAGRMLAEKCAHLKPEVVISPAMGGLIIGQETAAALGVPHLFCERVDGRLTLKRFPHPGRIRFLAVEDVITTGGSVKEMGDHLVDLGAEWAGTGSVVNRSGGKHILGDDPISLYPANFPIHEPDSCPLCKEGLELVKPGSREKPGQ